MSLSFRIYIKSATFTDTPAGDFIADAKQNALLPDATSWAELRDHLKARRIGRQAIKAALDAWREFEVVRDQRA